MGQGTDSCGGWDLEYDPYEENLCEGDWIQSDGSTINAADMSDSHLRNVIRKCNSLARSSNFSCDSDKWYDWLQIMEDALWARQSRTNSHRVNTPTTMPKSIITQVVQNPIRGATKKMKCHCGNHYDARVADLNRGWALSCSKSCAAIRRKYGKNKGEKL